MTAKLRSAYDLLVVAGPALGEGGAGLGAIAAQLDGVLAAVGPGQSSGRSPAGPAGRGRAGSRPTRSAPSSSRTVRRSA